MTDTIDLIVDGCDVTLPDHQECLWISIRNISVYVKRTDEGVVVDLFPKGQECGTSLASTYLFFQEADLFPKEIDMSYCKLVKDIPFENVRLPKANSQYGDWGATDRSRTLRVGTEVSLCEISDIDTLILYKDSLGRAEMGCISAAEHRDHLEIDVKIFDAPHMIEWFTDEGFTGEKLEAHKADIVKAWGITIEGEK